MLKLLLKKQLLEGWLKTLSSSKGLKSDLKINPQQLTSEDPACCASSRALVTIAPSIDVEIIQSHCASLVLFAIRNFTVP